MGTRYYECSSTCHGHCRDLQVKLSLSLPLPPSLSLSLYLNPSLSFSLRLFLSLSLFTSLYLYPSLSLSTPSSLKQITKRLRNVHVLVCIIDLFIIPSLLYLTKIGLLSTSGYTRQSDVIGQHS